MKQAFYISVKQVFRHFALYQTEVAEHNPQVIQPFACLLQLLFRLPYLFIRLSLLFIRPFLRLFQLDHTYFKFFNISFNSVQSGFHDISSQKDECDFYSTNTDLISG